MAVEAVTEAKALAAIEFAVEMDMHLVGYDLVQVQKIGELDMLAVNSDCFRT